jgi:hypothetical protein
MRRLERTSDMNEFPSDRSNSDATRPALHAARNGELISGRALLTDSCRLRGPRSASAREAPGARHATAIHVERRMHRAGMLCSARRRMPRPRSASTHALGCLRAIVTMVLEFTKIASKGAVRARGSTIIQPEFVRRRRIRMADRSRSSHAVVANDRRHARNTRREA